MACNAVVLTYLEWVRLVGRGWLRLQRFRVVPVDSWVGPLAQVNFDVLMENAPDVGLSATDYVLAELKFDAWAPISMDVPQLGRVLRLDQVQHLSCFNENAWQVMTATYNGPSESAVQLFEQPALWTGWIERVSRACADNRADRFLAHLNIPNPSDQFKREINEIFSKLPDTHHKSKGTKAFGWVTALAIPKQNLILSEKTTQASEAVKLIVKNLSSDFRVNEPFFDSQSDHISKEVFSDKQYEKICNALVVCAAYVHYAYLIQRSNYKEFRYDAFCKDVKWLKEKNIDLAAQLVDKTARDMPDELLSRVLSQNLKIPAKSPASSEGSALTAGVSSSTATSEAPDTAPNPENAGEKETNPVLPSSSPVSRTPPAPEKSSAHLLEEGTVGYPANKADPGGAVADIPQGQSTTKVNADAAPAAPEKQIEPSAGAKQVSGTSRQSATTGLDPRTKPTGDLFSPNESSSQKPTIKAIGTPLAAHKKPGEDFDMAYKQDVLKKIQDQGSNQGGSKKAFKDAWTHVWKEERLMTHKRLTKKEVKSWVEELDPELAKLLG